MSMVTDDLLASIAVMIVSIQVPLVVSVEAQRDTGL